MTKFSGYQGSSQIRKPKAEVHPIWRGLGFIYLILAPVLGYYGSLVLLDANKTNKWISIPANFLANGSDPLLFVKIGLTIVLAFLIFFILQFIGMAIYSLVGPPRYGPMDVPPITGVRKKKAR
jgi:hypothetical protein